ncbi:magnesium chelatase subunit ChlI family protein [Jeotgalibacillus terrae]|uniref:Mg chelatase-related protein C-terminal domain-containing protein n=1 Tax=Jeotgalibacillus terrae TaxID=587735 RepID=A0ABW5ZCJ0_9BACL
MDQPGYHEILRLAQTIADINGESEMNEQSVEEALQ